MQGLRRTEKFETDKPSNQNRSESDGEPAKPKGRPGRAREPSARRTGRGRTEEQRAEYQNRKDGMATGRTEEENEHRRNRCQGKTGRREKKGQKAE